MSSERLRLPAALFLAGACLLSYANGLTGAFVYDEGGFARALELLASGRLPNDLLVEPEDFPLSRLLDAAVGLHEGDLAAKAMIVPRVS